MPKPWYKSFASSMDAVTSGLVNCMTNGTQAAVLALWDKEFA